MIGNRVSRVALEVEKSCESVPTAVVATPAVSTTIEPDE